MILIAVGTVALTAEVAQAVEKGPVEIRNVAKSADPDYYAFPSVCRLANGDLLCVFYCGTGHISPNGKIVMARSKDEGKTWSKPEVIIDTAWDDRDPSIMQAKSGRVLVNSFDYDGVNRSRSGDKKPQVFVTISDDGGKTFGKPRPIDIGWPFDATSDAILQLRDGTLLLPLYGRKTGDTKDRAAVAFSKDGGLTWNKTDPVTIAYDEADKIDFQEPALVLLPDGTIRCSLRTTNVGYHAYESRSTDGGRTWSKPIDTGLRGHAACLLHHSSGVIFQAYRSWTEDGKMRGVAAVFCDPGKPWDPKKEFTIMLVGGDCAYPSAVELSDHSIFCVFYAREHRAVEAAVISPESIKALR